MAKTTGRYLNITKEERERLAMVCALDNRKAKDEVMWLVDRRLKELEKEKPSAE